MPSIEKDAKFCPYCGSPLDKIFIEGQWRAYCKKCERVIYDNPVPVVAGVILKGEEILLVKRGIYPRKGYWALPAGFVDIYEKAEDALIRELKEETNLDVKDYSFLKTINQKGMRYNSVLIIGFLINEFEGKIVPGDDAEDARFFSIKNIPELAFSSHNKLLDFAVKLKKNGK